MLLLISTKTLTHNVPPYLPLGEICFSDQEIEKIVRNTGILEGDAGLSKVGISKQDVDILDDSALFQLLKMIRVARCAVCLTCCSLRVSYLQPELNKCLFHLEARTSALVTFEFAWYHAVRIVDKD